MTYAQALAKLLGTGAGHLEEEIDAEDARMIEAYARQLTERPAPPREAAPEPPPAMRLPKAAGG